MKKFLFKLLFWVTPFFLLYFTLGLFSDHNTDDNYIHFTKQTHDIILGDSRASQAIVPDVLNGSIKNHDFDNFAFNIMQSPYGPVYLKGLKRKLLPDTKNAIFILSVSPWNLSASSSIKNEEDLPEKKISPLENMYCYNAYPNFEYLIKNYPNTWYYLYRDREENGRSSTYLHKNGWLEVSLDMSPSKKREKSFKEKIALYQSLSKEHKKSELRLKSFQEIIDFLKSKGKICIVRIPASEQLMEIEKKYWTDFNDDMKQISKKNNIHYFDFSNHYSHYQYTDGNHMYKESSKIFSKQIADSILAIK